MISIRAIESRDALRVCKPHSTAEPLTRSTALIATSPKQKIAKANGSAIVAKGGDRGLRDLIEHLTQSHILGLSQKPRRSHAKYSLYWRALILRCTRVAGFVCMRIVCVAS